MPFLKLAMSKMSSIISAVIVIYYDYDADKKNKTDKRI